MLVKSDQGNSTNFLQLASGTNGPALRFNSSAPAVIPDNTLNGNSPIVVANVSGAIANVGVSVYITHSFDADLSLQLIAPDGTSTLLSGNNGFGPNYGISCSPDSSRTTFSDDAITPIGNGAPPYLGCSSPINRCPCSAENLEKRQWHVAIEGR